MKTIIAIGREYGSGGREIGERLAKEFNIPFYDKELLAEAARESGISEEAFIENDEKHNRSFLYSLAIGGYGSGNLPFNHKLFLAQFDAIRALANQGPCVIIGRCADYALEDNPNCLSVFIHADIKSRIERAVKYYDVPENNAEKVISIPTENGETPTTTTSPLTQASSESTKQSKSSRKQLKLWKKDNLQTTLNLYIA